MKTTKELLDESRERGRARLAERQEIESRGFDARCEVRRANEDLGQHAMADTTFDALSAAERAIGKVDSAMDRLELLRIELVQITIGERWHQTERPPQIDDLVRELGELAGLLHVREILARKESR